MKLLIFHTHTPLRVNLKVFTSFLLQFFLKSLKFVLVVGEVGGKRKIKERSKFKTISAQTNTKQSIERKTAKGNAV